MLPISSKKPAAFTPASYKGAEGAPVYLIEVPTLLRRAELWRAVAETGAKYHSENVLLEYLRDAIEAHVEADQQAELLELVDVCEAKGLDALDADLAKDLSALQEQIAQHDERFRKAVYDHSYWQNVAPIVAAQLFLVGVQGQKPFERRHGKLSDGVLEDLPVQDVTAIGGHVFMLMSVSKEEEKN